MIGVADTSKLGGERGCKETTSIGVPKWADERIPEGGILCTDFDKCLIKFTWKNWMRFWFSWAKMILKEGNSDGKAEGYPVGTYDDKKISLSNNRLFGVSGFYKVEEELKYKEGVSFCGYEWAD